MEEKLEQTGGQSMNNPKIENKVTDYQYKNFRLEYFTFQNPGGPEIGEYAPDFQVSTLDGKHIKLSDFKGKKVILEAGSYTCPLYVNNIKPMNKLADEFPDFIFLVLYVREAHPGEKQPYPINIREKQLYASKVKLKDKENRLILIDDISGTTHKLYSVLPNWAYVIGEDQKIIYRAEWNNPKSIKNVLQGIIIDRHVYPVPRMRIPMLPRLLKVLYRGGFVSMKDFFPTIPKLIISRKKLNKELNKQRIERNLPKK
ncbi:MAG: redoxin domain-containing protein [Candidatus Heimdallarchaeota archaeon]|nr:redoxin domain-containing protein [Candidatus Heimdallarchaeota archaeon]MDH5644722.1 redoxin domain-containing protein [Candidatus Heimdallarchaeota archaeon]